MIQKMKGMYDVTTDIALLQTIEKKIDAVSKLFQFKELRTPHVEAHELFHRGVGESTDIVQKETYTFEDRGGRLNTLRPEGTAGVVRAYIENKLFADPIVPQKYYYMGSMFRYERPQKGRFREFRQFGAELFGSERAEADAEIIAYAMTLLRSLKLKDASVHLNSLGGEHSKAAYKDALVAHLKPHVETLCDDCKRRFNSNPLRILDCKIDQKHQAIIEAPKPLAHLTKEDRDHFDQVLKHLDAMQIAYVIDDRLVRGLDYYTHTVFEIKVSETLLGKQNAICGGGRYNDLVETLGGPKTAAVGFAFGIERLMVALKAAKFPVQTKRLHAFFIVLGESARLDAFALMQRLRLGGMTCNTDFLDKSIKAQFRLAERQNPRFIVILGEEEVITQHVQVKDQDTGENFTVGMEDFYVTLYDKLTRPHADCEDCEKGVKS